MSSTALSVDETREIVDKAQKAVDHMGEGEYKKKAFEIILKEYLQKEKFDLKEDDGSSHSKEEPIEKDNSSENDSKGVDKLIEDAGFSESQFDSLFDVEGSKANILSLPSRNKPAEEQFACSILLLLTNYYINGSYEMHSSKLREKLENHGIRSLTNLSTNLSTKKRYILRKGDKKGNTNTHYKITFPGIQEGLRLLKEMSSAQEDKDGKGS